METTVHEKTKQKQKQNKQTIMKHVQTTKLLVTENIKTILNKKKRLPLKIKI